MAVMDPSVQCRFKWEVDSFAMWDNRAVQHFATNDFWPQTRVVERVTIKGDAPY
jgi:taurine dioxygenase